MEASNEIRQIVFITGKKSKNSNQAVSSCLWLLLIQEALKTEHA